jgi:hypothetical protein
LYRSTPALADGVMAREGGGVPDGGAVGLGVEDHLSGAGAVAAERRLAQPVEGNGAHCGFAQAGAITPAGQSWRSRMSWRAQRSPSAKLAMAKASRVSTVGRAEIAASCRILSVSGESNFTIDNSARSGGTWCAVPPSRPALCSAQKAALHRHWIDRRGQSVNTFGQGQVRFFMLGGIRPASLIRDSEPMVTVRANQLSRIYETQWD